MPGQRRLEPDLLKAVGIGVVVLIHSMRSPFAPGVSGVEVWLGDVTRFAVPGFLLASGLLYATREPVPWAVTRGRLARIFVPYLVATALAQLVLTALGGSRSPLYVLRDVALASSFFHYYYVWIALLAVLSAPLLARAGSRALAVVLGFGVVAQYAIESQTVGPLPFVWHVRNPLLWGAYFVLGWGIGLHLPAVQAWLAPRRRAAVASMAAAVLGLAAAAAFDLSFGWARAVQWLGIYAVLALLLSVSLGRETRSPALRELSEATYTIYLFHVFFVDLVRRAIHPAPGEFEPLAILLPWLAGLAGSLALVWLGRRVLGERSRTWLGA
jgi:surface polysaccharide O-acyltransferase-like enzyme